MGWTLPPPGPHDARSVSDFNEHKRKKIRFAEKQAAFPGGSVDKKSACNAGHTGELSLIPGSRRAPGRGHVHPLWCSCLENHMDRGAWQATVHRVTESDMTEVT